MHFPLSWACALRMSRQMQSDVLTKALRAAERLRNYAAEEFAELCIKNIRPS